MKLPVVVIGIGEIGSVLARGLLRCGYPVYPATRANDMALLAEHLPEPMAVVVAVGEGDIAAVLVQLPPVWRSKIVLLQNELLPRDWLKNGLQDPTVISIWFEKKSGQDVKVLIPSPIYGAHANLIADALASLNIPTKIVADSAALLFELVNKNVYILTTNIAGLVCGGTVEALLNQHRDLMQAVADDVIDIQRYLTGEPLDVTALMQGFQTAVHGDLQHKCMGRSAPARLRRALTIADETGLAVPKLRAVAEEKL